MKRVGYIVIPIIVIIIGYSFLGQGESEEDYIEKIKQERVEKDSFMKESESSPFVNKRDEFTGLQYFPIDPEFKVKATIIKFDSNQYMEIAETGGEVKRYLKFATAQFTLKGQELELLLLKPVGFGPMDVIFTAFADDTSGESTYGGGRYLDLSFKNATEITIDFNLAYNPYCEYTPDFSCPLPPKENILPIAITAGEKNYKN